MDTAKGIDYIMRLLPHRYPFLMLDKVTELEFCSHARGYKNISIAEEVFSGHFSDQAIFPGVLIIEALAQLGGLMFIKKACDRDVRKSDMAYICGVDRTRFLTFVTPGNRLDLECYYAGEFGGLKRVKGTAKLGQRIACKTEITYASQEMIHNMSPC